MARDGQHPLGGSAWGPPDRNEREQSFQSISPSEVITEEDTRDPKAADITYNDTSIISTKGKMTQKLIEKFELGINKKE